MPPDPPRNARAYGARAQAARAFGARSDIGLQNFKILATPLVAATTLSRSLIIVFLLLNILSNLILYKSISHTVRKHPRTIQAQQNIASHLQRRSGLDVKKYNKSVGTTALIFGTFCLCYVPTLCSIFVARVYVGLDVMSWEVKMATEVSYMVFVFNSTLNPLLYCLRITDIRSAVHRIFTFRKF